MPHNQLIAPPFFGVECIYQPVGLLIYLLAAVCLSASLYISLLLPEYIQLYVYPRKGMYICMYSHTPIYLYRYNGMWDSIHKYLYAVGYRYTKTA